MKKLLILGCAALLVGVAAVARAQHEGHQMPGQPQAGAQAAPAETIRACVQAQQEIAVVADRVNARLEAARQTNSPAEMRSAMDDLQAALVEIRARAAACTALQAAVPAGGEPAGHTMGTMQQEAPGSPGTPVMQPGSTTPAPAAPMRPMEHSGMTHSPAPQGTAAAAKGSQATTAQPTEAVDPVCSMKVDPRTAPKATYKGKTYYFCSQADHDLFVKAPEKYVKQ